MSLWYVDRSRYEAGTQHCSWDRYLSYHFGPSGYGINRKAESLPLGTGTGYHVGGELLGEWALQHPDATALPLDVIRHAAAEARSRYEAKARASGIYGVGDPTQLDTLIGEQSSLIGGLVWCEGLEFWPWLLREYQVIAVETEETLVLDCTCGLGSRIGSAADHEARACQGICFMSRPDLLTRSRSRLASHQYLGAQGHQLRRPRLPRPVGAQDPVPRRHRRPRRTPRHPHRRDLRHRPVQRGAAQEPRRRQAAEFAAVLRLPAAGDAADAGRALGSAVARPRAHPAAAEQQVAQAAHLDAAVHRAAGIGRARAARSRRVPGPLVARSHPPAAGRHPRPLQPSAGADRRLPPRPRAARAALAGDAVVDLPRAGSARLGLVRRGGASGDRRADPALVAVPEVRRRVPLPVRPAVLPPQRLGNPARRRALRAAPPAPRARAAASARRRCHSARCGGRGVPDA